MLPIDTNIVLGSGHIYFDEFSSSGKLTGEVYLSETPGFEVAMASDSIDVDSSDTPFSEVIASIATKIARSATLTVKSMSADVYRLFLVGEVSQNSVPSGASTNDPINNEQGVTKGKWYQLGISSTERTGTRNITSLNIHDKGSTSPYTKVDDYIEDLSLARIYIVPGTAGAIADGTVIEADFTESASTWEEISSQDTGIKRGAIRYIADNTFGENRDLYLPDVFLKPSGSLAFKSRDTVQEVSFDISISRPSDGSSAVYLNGRPA